MLGNNQIIVGGGKFDTGKKWIDSNGVGHVIYQKTLALDGTTSSLPNNAAKNVAHGEDISLTKWHKVVGLRADNGTLVKTENSAGVSVDLNVTNVVVTTTSDLSLYLRGSVTIEFCLD